MHLFAQSKPKSAWHAPGVRLAPGLRLAGLFHGSLGPCHSDFETVSYWLKSRPVGSSRVSQLTEFGCRSVSTVALVLAKRGT